MNIEIGQVVTQIISFLVMLWVMKRYAWKPLLNALDGRRNKIKKDLDAIEKQKKEVEKMAEEYREKIKGIEAYSLVKTQEAIEIGKERAQAIQQEAQVQAKAMITKTQADLQKEIGKAKIQLKNELVKITLSATEKLIKSDLDPKKQANLVSDFIDQVGKN